MRSAVPRALLAAVVALASAAGLVLAATEKREPRARGAGAWETGLAESPFSRSEVGAARVGDRIYVVGGFLSDGATTGRMAAYDISADRWVRRRPLPRGVNHPGVASLGGRLYVLGGQRAAGERPTAALWRYSPARNRWKRLPSAPTERAAMALAAGNGKLYAAGGQTDGSFELRRLEVYDVSARRWRTRAPMPTGRNHLTGAFARGDFWAIGGRGSGGNSAAVERFDPASGKWSSEAPLNVPRGGIAAAVAHRSIVVLGGEELQPGGTTIAEVERLPLDDLAGGWQLLEDMPTPRHGLGAAAMGDFVYALEGGPEPRLTTSSLVERLDLAALP